MHGPTVEQVKRANDVAEQVKQWRDKQSGMIECQLSCKPITAATCEQYQAGFAIGISGRPASKERRRDRESLCRGCERFIEPLEEA